MKILFLNFVIALLYIAGGYLSFSLEHINNIVTLAIFFPEGIALAAVLIYGKKIIPGIFVGQFLLAFTTEMPISVSLAIALSNSFEAWLAFYISQKIRLQISVTKPNDIYKLFGMILFILQPFSAIFGNISLLLGGLIMKEQFVMSTLTWWFGNVMGQILLTPVLLLLYSSIVKRTFRVIYLLEVFVFSMIIFIFVGLLPLQNMAILMSFTIPFVMLLISYFGIEYGAVSILFIASFTILEKIFDINIFSGNTTLTVININFFIIAHIVITYTYGILQSQKENALREIKLLNNNLACKVKKEVQKSREKDKFLLYKSRLAQMGEMINMIAHQWRQPLNIISMLQQSMVLKYKKGDLSDAVVKEFSDKFNEQINYMSQTIDDFRDFFKPEKEKETFLLNDTVQNAIDMIYKSFHKENISLTYNEKIKNAMVVGYPNEFSQVVLNILNNAKDALTQNECQNKAVIVTLMKIEGQYGLYIEDNGGGIKNEHLEKIFEPYFSTKEQYNGTGLGLYICKMIIEEHMQGKIEAKNVQKKEEKGAKFCIYLPITQEEITNASEK